MLDRIKTFLGNKTFKVGEISNHKSGKNQIRREDVILGYRFLLGREPESEDVIISKINSHATREELIKDFISSYEFKNRIPFDNFSLRNSNKSELDSYSTKIYPLDWDIAPNPDFKTKDIFCQICGQNVQVIIEDESNLRDDCKCSCCGSINRQRQLIHVLLNMLPSDHTEEMEHKTKDLGDVKNALQHAAVYNTETKGAVHDSLNKYCGDYRCSEYFGEKYQGGQIVKGVMHQDLTNLSFEDNSFDYVFSSDVFEHIHDPYQAFAEVHRVLKKGGRHIFTVPYYMNGFQDETRAKVVNGNLVHLMNPIYHKDPIREKEGALVFTIFSLEMLTKLHKIGFHTNLYRLFEPKLGIFGNNALVFDTAKL